MTGNTKSNMEVQSIPEVTLNSSIAKTMPVLGLGTGADPILAPEAAIKAVLEAIGLGYRMFDTSSAYQTEETLGEAISQALSLGLIKSRNQVFITSKLWCTDNHGNCVLPALRKTLQLYRCLTTCSFIFYETKILHHFADENLRVNISSSLLLCRNMKLDYLDQYLIHFPVSTKHEAKPFPDSNPEDVVPINIKSVWTAMEECQTLGLAKSIGVSNFSCKKLADILAFANIPPVINQVEMNPTWQQGKLREFCQANGIKIAAYSPLGAAGAHWGTKGVLESEVLMEIANSKGKSVAQVALRWAYEQGVVIVMKSFNKETKTES